MFLIRISRKAQWKKTTTPKDSKGVRNQVQVEMCACVRSRQDAYFEALHSWLVFETQICWNLDQKVKDTVQSLKLENDKLKDKIQEICAELRNLRDEVKAERNGAHASSSEGTDEGNTTATPNSIQEDFKKYVNDRMSLIEKSLER